MKPYLTIACLLLSFYAKAQNIQEVHITNIEKKKGTLYVGWYDSKKAFMKPQQTVFVKLIAVDGFSNGTPAMRPATFSEAQIEVNGEKMTIPIKLK